MSLDKEKIKKIVEGALFSSGQPMNIDRLGSLFFDEERPSKDEFKEALAELQEAYSDRGVVLKEVASGYRFQVKEEFGEWVSRLWDEKPVRYSRALLETLALVAYRQPITRGEIEEIRGVSVSSHIMKTLLEREWVRIVGHRDVPGRPAMFATTRNFLDYFDLKNLDELPPLSEIRDFDKINEELELEYVAADDQSETVVEKTSDADVKESDAVIVSTPGEDAVDESAVENVVEESVVEESAVEETAVEEPAAKGNTFADLARRFEAQKEQEAEFDASDAAVASEAQVEEDLMVAEVVERQLEQGSEIEVITDTSIDDIDK